MEARREKVYVALGNELQDGFKTLEWTLRRWKSQSISIVILHVTYSISGKDYVYNPFGKLPAASVSDEKLKILRRYEQEKIDKILSKYIAFCGNVKTEILKVEKYDESSHKLILDLISGLHITKLVVGFSFIKSSSWRPKIAISVAFYIHEHKAESCELFIICGGKEVFLRGENDQIIMEDGKGVMVAKMKDEVSIKFLIEKMFLENRHSSLASPTKKDSINLQNLWENFAQEIEVYYQQLCSNLDAEDYELGNGTGTSQLPSPTEAIMMQMNGNPNMSLPEKYESLRTKISETQARMRLKKKEAKENANRHAKAERAICLCERRAQELDVHVKEEGDNRRELKKELDTQKEQLHAEVKDIQESRNKIRSLIELQSELSHKLHISKMAKSQAKVQLENEVMKRVDMVRDIEVLRRERDVFRRRIEFCRQKDATETTEGLSELSCCLREYTDEEIKLATDKFSERFRLKSGIDLTSVYKGRINHVTVAIKVLNSAYTSRKTCLRDGILHDAENLVAQSLFARRQTQNVAQRSFAQRHFARRRPKSRKAVLSDVGARTSRKSVLHDVDLRRATFWRQTYNVLPFFLTLRDIGAHMSRKTVLRDVCAPTSRKVFFFFFFFFCFSFGVLSLPFSFVVSTCVNVLN
ncbi:hypothetical protein ACFX2I_000467 [Malus domestica]